MHLKRKEKSLFVCSEMSFDRSFLGVWLLVVKGVNKADIWLAHFLSKFWNVI